MEKSDKPIVMDVIVSGGVVSRMAYYEGQIEYFVRPINGSTWTKVISTPVTLTAITE